MNIGEISIVLVTQNDGTRLRRCLDSVEGFGEIIVVDEFSTDDTVAVARSHGATVFLRPPSDAAAQRNWGLDRVRNRWVMWLETCDVVGDGLRRAIEHLEPEDRFAGYSVGVDQRYLGRRIRCADRGGVALVRLINRERSRFDTGRGDGGGEPRVCLDGPVMATGGELGRYRYDTIEDHIEAIQRSSTSRARRAAGGRGNRALLALNTVVRPPISFFEGFVLRGGFLEGRRGFLYCLISSYGVFLDQAKAWESVAKGRTGAAPD